MNRCTALLAQFCVVSACWTVPAFAADDEALEKDLTAVIALNGFPCDEVVAVTTQAESDYAASCKDGNKYRVYMNAAGRVVVEKRK